MFNLLNFYLYSDLSGFYLLVVDEGSWSAKDERTWRVEGLKCSMSEGDKFLKASMDVTFDGANYVVLNVERTIAKEADLDSGDPAKAPVETLRFLDIKRSTITLPEWHASLSLVIGILLGTMVLIYRLVWEVRSASARPPIKLNRFYGCFFKFI